MSGPLEDMRVVDLSGMIAGGFATMTLADFGADVVMVEHPDYYDPIRDWTPFEDDISLWWKSIARNKRCVTLDLSSDEGRELCLDLVEDADLVVENFRPGTLERWGLDYEALKAVNEEIVMVRVSGYGQTGPRSEKPGFGTVAEAISGFAHANGFPDREPLLPPISLADLCTAHYAVQSAMFALWERDRSGEGQVVDVSLYESLFRMFPGDVEKYHRKGEITQRSGNKHPNSAPRGVYEAKDGYVALSASAQAIFENLAETIGRSDLIEDGRFATNGDRVENADELDEYIDDWMSQYPVDEAIEKLQAGDAIVGPIYDMSDIFEDEQYQAREDIVEIDDPDIGPTKTPAALPKFSRTPGEVDHLGPRHGEHNEEIFLDELELDPAEYERLREQDVV